MLEYWADVVSDFSRFHRIRGVEEHPDLDCAEFFALAHRLDVYGGAVALRVAQWNAAQTPASPQMTEMSFDDWVSSNQALVIQAANAMTGGDRGA